jgi:hypothetical protein
MTPEYVSCGNALALTYPKGQCDALRSAGRTHSTYDILYKPDAVSPIGTAPGAAMRTQVPDAAR